jgi:redox-sensitive bicupin YhaK (pirin superfamily)
MFDDPYELEAADGARLTVRSAATQALILEVRLPAAATASWFSALAGYGKRFEVLRGALLVDGETVLTGERMIVAGDRELTLTAGLAEEVHFVCDLKPAGERSALVAALEATLARAPSAGER